MVTSSQDTEVFSDKGAENRHKSSVVHGKAFEKIRANMSHSEREYDTVFKRFILLLARFQYVFLLLRGVVIEALTILYHGIVYLATYGPVASIKRCVSREVREDVSCRFSIGHLYLRWVYGQLSDVFGRRVCSGAGSTIHVGETDHTKSTRALNLGSYNYLGFGAEMEGICHDAVRASLKKYRISPASSHACVGKLEVVQWLEQTIVKFLGRNEDSECIVFPMGHATNTSGISALLRNGDVVFSDSLNHNSIAVGCMAVDGLVVKRFKHNDMLDLESKIQDALWAKYPSGTRPKRFVIIAEGIYSMEGDFCDLPALVRIKKRYKAYLYIDEAHSIGCTGPSGRGVCEHFGVDPNDVDVLMGTFSKSFASCGGYICSTSGVIRHLRSMCSSYMYDTGMSGACASQTLTSMKIIMGDIVDKVCKTGKDRITSLRRNTQLLRRGLRENGFELMGDESSPVVPMMLYLPTALAAFSRECLARNLAVVVVGYPATSFMSIRARFCVSAGHTEQEIQTIIDTIVTVGKMCMVDFGNQFFCDVRTRGKNLDGEKDVHCN